MTLWNAKLYKSITIFKVGKNSKKRDSDTEKYTWAIQETEKQEHLRKPLGPQHTLTPGCMISGQCWVDCCCCFSFLPFLKIFTLSVKFTLIIYKYAKGTLHVPAYTHLYMTIFIHFLTWVNSTKNGVKSIKRRKLCTYWSYCLSCVIPQIICHNKN